MITLRPAAERGATQIGWLDSRHTFSFGEYRDPRHMGFRSLRVINDDRVAPGAGFGKHGHRDMEILSYVVSGALEHRDSMNNGSVVRPGEVQYMRAGSGVRHSEYNASDDEVLKFLQIWIVPNRPGGAPGYDQRKIDDVARDNRFRVVASGDPKDDAILIQQDARLLTAKLAAGAELDYPLAQGRGAWVQVVSGELDVNGTALGSGDGAALEDESALHLTAKGPSEILLFDLGE